jgi:hypothetical protein
VFVHGSRSKRPVDNGRWDEKVFPEQTIPLFPVFREKVVALQC